jgi:integrase
MSHQFTYLDKKRTLVKKKPTDAHWYFAPRWGDRDQKVWHCLKDKETGRALTLVEAEAAAKTLILERLKSPTQYDKLREQTKLRGNLTVGSIIDAWVAAGYPIDDGTPRTAEQQQRQADLLPGLLPWWRPKLVSDIAGPLLKQYATWRQANCRKGFTGKRVVDADLTVLSNAFAWSVGNEDGAKTNPFRGRPRFQKAKSVVHCTAYMPSSADELHILCGALMLNADPYDTVAGALLMYLALSGQRPGEGQFLRWDAKYAGQRPEPGHRYTVTLDGTPAELLAVKRLKAGINPAVRVRPALAAFLSHWQPYSQARWRSNYFFPNPADRNKPYDESNGANSRRLAAVATQLQLGERHAHSMRAFYVRVRRSQGADDGTIALELGQGSGARMIVDTYGEAHGIHGDGRFDWLPAAGTVPCWERLPAPTSNIVNL